MNCRCEACGYGSRYFCLKTRAGLLDQDAFGALSEDEKQLVGLCRNIRSGWLSGHDFLRILAKLEEKHAGRPDG